MKKERKRRRKMMDQGEGGKNGEVMIGESNEDGGWRKKMVKGEG